MRKRAPARQGGGGGGVLRAAQLQRWMAEDGVAPDAPLCTQLLSCYAAGGQAGAAQQLVDAMAAGGSRPLCTASCCLPEARLRTALATHLLYGWLSAAACPHP